MTVMEMEVKMLQELQKSLDVIKDAREYGLDETYFQKEFFAQARLVERVTGGKMVVDGWKILFKAPGKDAPAELIGTVR